jgi:spermidine/putrescine transport system substrate-binding protein
MHRNLFYLNGVGYSRSPPVSEIRMNRVLVLFFSLLLPGILSANSVVNVYAWGGEIPKSVIHQFEHDTGIKVNFSTYDSNETMYAKLRSSRRSAYDVIMPSAYYVERMQKKGLLKPLNHHLLPNLKNLDPHFTSNQYDDGNHYSIPMIWGATGIFYTDSSIKKIPMRWEDLWDTRWKRQLMLLDDAREVFSMALMRLHYSPNDTDPAHIKEAYHALLALIPNIKLFASDGIQAILIDEDANLGSAWNGDVVKARAENKHVHFVYPEDGFVIWIDCLAIPDTAPHPKEAHQFINYLLSATTAARIAHQEGHAITNRAGRLLLPKNEQNAVDRYPDDAILKRGHVQRDVDDTTLELYHHYWQALKLAF